jgi:hypothetical protein
MCDIIGKAAGLSGSFIGARMVRRLPITIKED